MRSLIQKRWFFLNNQITNGSVLKKEKRRLVVDGEDIYWLVDGKRLSKNKAGDLQKRIDDEYFNEKSET